MPMQPWFRDAKLGIFVHYGIYAVEGVRESWSFYSGQLSREVYMAQLDRFTAAAYDPEAWAGARYAVLTARHHDGGALWDTAYGDLDVVRNTPAGRELLGGYAEALRERGLRVGGRAPGCRRGTTTGRAPCPRTVAPSNCSASTRPGRPCRYADCARR